MFSVLMLLTLPAFAWAHAQGDSRKLTPTDAYQIARAADREFVKRRATELNQISPEMLDLARQERVRLAKQYIAGFNLSDWNGDHLLNLSRLYMLANEPAGVEAVLAAYQERMGANLNLPVEARKLLFWSLVNRGKWDQAMDVANQLLNGSKYDQEIDRDIQTLLKGLKETDVPKAVALAERRLPQLTNLLFANEESKAIFMAERAEDLAELYAEVGKQREAIELLTAERDKFLKLPGSSEELRFTQRLLSAALRRVALPGTPAPLVVGNVVIDTKFSGLDSFRGKVVLLDFFAHSCGPCVFDLPKMEALHRKYRKEGLGVVVITSLRGYFGSDQNLKPEEELAFLKQLKNEKHASLGFVVGPPTNFYQYGVVTLPAIALIDRAGNVRVVKRYPDVNRLEESIKTLLSERPPRGS